MYQDGNEKKDGLGWAAVTKYKHEYSTCMMPLLFSSVI